MRETTWYAMIAAFILLSTQVHALAGEEAGKVFIPIAPDEAAEWSYTTDRPAEGWEKPDFDDSSWKRGKAGFGAAMPNATIRTVWDTGDIWLRKPFDLSGDDVTNSSRIALTLFHDDDCEVYVNGAPVLRRGGCVGDYGRHWVRGSGQVFQTGRNVLAVHCRNEGGPQYIDAGLSARDMSGFSYDQPWKGMVMYGKDVAFSRDDRVKFGKRHSLRIENSDYADSGFRKTVPVDQNTDYRVSAMARYSGYRRKPEDQGEGGANISIWGEWTVSERHTGTAWKRIELCFNSGDRTEVDLALRNGFWNGACKGAAWFSDLKIEKRDMAPSGTDWNFLCLIFKNIDVTVEWRGRKDHRHKKSCSSADIAEITKALKWLPDSFRDISGGRMRIAALDIMTVDAPVTQLSPCRINDTDGYNVDPNSIKTILDRHMDKKDYNQIIMVYPIGELAGCWGGLGGGYRTIGFAQHATTPGDRWVRGSPFPDAIYAHETLHHIEWRAGQIRETAALHDAEKYGYDGHFNGVPDGWREWYRAYGRNTLPDGRGLPPEAYTVYNGKYEVISTGMEMEAALRDAE